MNFPSVQHLRRPLYVFSDDQAHTHPDKFRGLLRYTPIRQAKNKQPRCMFIFAENDRDFANRLYLALHNGVGSFPGMAQFTGVAVSRDRLDALRLPAPVMEVGGQRLIDVVSKQVKETPPEFAFIIGTANWRFRRASPYSAIKAALLRQGVPSQFVSKELLRSEVQFQYAIPNIALASFVKLGGVPWLIKRQESAPAMVLGVGTTTVLNDVKSTRQRFLGFAICMLADGLVLDMSFLGAALTYEDFLPQLQAGLRQTIVKLGDTGRTLGRLTVHVSHFERRQTIEAITSVLEDSRGENQMPVPFEVLRLTHDSPFMVIDPDHAGFVSSEGTAVHLGPQHSLVVTEGRQEQAKWRGRKPVTLEVHREYAAPASVPFGDSLRDAFQLCFVNWRGFGTKSMPVTLAYAKLLSERLADMALIQPDIIDFVRNQHSLTKTLWFL